MTVMLLLLFVLHITFVSPASLHDGEEKEQILSAEMDISVSLAISLCDDIECKHGGTCFQGRCLCPADTTGTYCEVVENPCDRNPCEVTPTCNFFLRTFFCDCQRGFADDNDCGVIQSPNYPDNYNNSIYISWRILPVTGKYIQIQFDDLFEIQVTRTDSCENMLNYARSYGKDDCADGVVISSGSIYFKYCGGAPPSPITSYSTADMYVVFNTDDACSYSGFKLSYRYVDVDAFQPENPIMSPSYPNEYPAYTYRAWTVPGRDGFNLTFTFNGVFNLPYGTRDESNCSIVTDEDTCTDHVAIESILLKYKLCGDTKPDPIVIPDGWDTVVLFQSEGTCGFEGFNLTYTYIG